MACSHLLPAGPIAANPPYAAVASAGEWDRQARTERQLAGRTLYRFIDRARHIMRAVTVIMYVIVSKIFVNVKNVYSDFLCCNCVIFFRLFANLFCLELSPGREQHVLLLLCRLEVKKTMYWWRRYCYSRSIKFVAFLCVCANFYRQFLWCSVLIIKMCCFICSCYEKSEVLIAVGITMVSQTSALK